ncbi:MAG: TIGR01458 family HAD-type hydrolase [Methanospirillaceae archaeon]|nr:TIGR01458 family HAD-type hydrolase [Methanospirillaceae archaeon]
MKIRGILIDIDGVIRTAGKKIPGAEETVGFLKHHDIPFLLLSNTTRTCRKTIARNLVSAGIAVSVGDILTPAAAAVRYLKGKGIAECSLLATGDVDTDFADEGITIRNDSSVIIVGDAGDNFTYPSLVSVFRQVLQGAELIALERDRYWMDTDGLTLAAGPFVAGIEYATGVSARVMGKPSPSFFEQACDAIGMRSDECIMVGDDIYSDIGGAQAAGIRGFLVTTGKYNKETVAASGITPHTVIDSIASLIPSLQAQNLL